MKVKKLGFVSSTLRTRIVNAAAITSVLWAGALASAAHAQACQWVVSDGGNSNFRNLAFGPALAGLRFGVNLEFVLSTPVSLPL